MKKFQKYFDWEECPLCGHSLVITTDCDPANDTERFVALCRWGIKARKFQPTTKLK